MATLEALIKYYNCLRESFNKIQDKDNKEALINAALRPKIRDEFEKSQELLKSYLDYIKVFSLIYSEKFVNVCNTILVPLFKEHDIKVIGSLNDNSDGKEEKDAAISDILMVHETIRSIIESKPELSEDYIHSVIRVFPGIHGDEPDKNKIFFKYLKNCFEICTYVEGEPLKNLITKILDKLNPPFIEGEEEEERQEVTKTLNRSYELIYECLNDLHETELEKIVFTLLTIFTRDFVSSPIDTNLSLFILYICSLRKTFIENLLSSLWSVFTKSCKSIEERRGSIIFASSIISRANYIDLDMAFGFLENASNWCKEFLKNHRGEESVEAFHVLTQSIFYIVTQRYREMYENESIERLRKLSFDQIVDNHLKPLEVCDPETERRFQEVSSLYLLVSKIGYTHAKKRRKINSNNWSMPFNETCESLPKRIQPLYRNYYDHRNFTVYRE